MFLLAPGNQTLAKKQGWGDVVTRDEHKTILGLIDLATKPGIGGAETPVDVEADAIIRALFVRKPEAAYRITMLALAQARELNEVKLELDERRKGFRGNWLGRLLKKQGVLTRNKRRDPRLMGLPQNINGR